MTGNDSVECRPLLAGPPSGRGTTSAAASARTCARAPACAGATCGDHRSESRVATSPPADRTQIQWEAGKNPMGPSAGQGGRAATLALPESAARGATGPSRG
jgi:hypothetical protein